MKKRIMLAVAACSFAVAAQAQDKPATPEPAAPTAVTPPAPAEGKWPANVTKIDVQSGRATMTGALAKGQPMTDLAVRCIEKAEQDKFAGNVVLYGVTLPKDQELKITVMPKEKGKSLSVFAYSMPADRYDLPKAGTSGSEPPANAAPGTKVDSMQCEKSVGGETSLGKAFKGDERVIRLEKEHSPANVIIGVSAPKGSTAGDFTVELETRP